jgi:hypothetical protein
MTAKIVYQTDLNGIFIRPAEADPCPIEEGVWLIPAGCVELPPPATPADKAAYWDGQHWHLIDSLLGLTAYNTATRAPVHIDRLGPLPAGYTLKEPGANQVWKNAEWTDDIPATVVRLYTEKLQAINTACEQSIIAGFTSTALGAMHRYSSQLDDQLNLMGAILRGLEMPYACRNEQDVKAFRMHSAEQLRQIGDDFTQYKLQRLQQANTLKQQLEQAQAASDILALEAINWEAVQP